MGFYYYDVLRDSNLTKQGDYSTAFGSNTVASGDNSTAFGSSTQALGDFSTAFGSNTVASGDNSTAFGSSTKATGSSSTAFGSITEANGPSGTAFGSGTMANGQHSTAFGSSSIASGYISTAFGSNTQAGKLTYKKADGREIEAKIVEYTTAAGVRNYKIVSLRNENDVLSDNNGAGFNMYDSAFLDENLTRQGDYSTAFGSSTIALGDYSTAWGFSAQANGGYSTAFGSGTEASGTGATAWGSGTKAGGDYSTAWGFSAQANGTYSTAFGNGSVANAYNSLAALGGTTGEKATNSVAIGTGATVGGAYNSENPQTAGANAFAFGNGAQATLSDSVALGSGAVANRAKYNASNNAYKAYLNEDDNNQKTDPAWRATHNAIAVGASATDSDTATVTRQITGVAAGTYDTDAVNVAQLKAATFNMQGITRTRSGNDNDGYTYTTTIEDKLSVSSNGAFSISGDNFTVALDGAISAAGGISAAKGAGGYNFTVDSSDGSIRTNGNISAVGDISADNITVAEGTYSYISAGTDVAGSLVSLDSQVKTNTDAIATKANTTDITVAADGNYISAGTDVAGSLVSLDNAVKANAGTIQGITRSGDATDGYTTTIEGNLSVSSNGAFSISGDKFTVNSDGAISAAGGKFSVGTNGGIVAADQKFRVDDSTGSMTVGSATQNTSVSDAGLTITDGPSVTKDGIDAGRNKITNVAIAESDTDAVNYKQLIDVVTSMSATGGEFITGQGLTTETKSENNNSVVVFKVKAGEGLGFDSDGALKVNAGDIAENDAGFVTGGTVYSALQAYQPEGEVAAGNAKAVSGATVFSALSAYAKSDGATLTGTTISSGSIADDVNLVGVDSSITVGSLKSSVATNTSAITALNETINDGSDGLVVKVTALEDTVGNAERGLVKKVDDNTAAIGTINTSITGINDSITSLSSGKANIDLDNITDNGKATMRSLAKESVKVVAGTNTTVTKGADGNADTYAVDVVANGSVASGDTGLVAGGTVFNALSAYAKAEGAILTNATLSNATISSGSIADGVTIGSSGVTIGSLKSNVDSNTSDISALKATLNDSNTGIIKKVNDNASAIQTNATNIAANKTAIDKNAGDITNLNTKVSANETAIQTNATNIAANKTAIEKNASDIATNKASIQTNATNIAANKTAIAKNTSDIATNKAAIQTNAANIAANKTAIEKNASDIATNKASIQTNATNIAANKTAIEKNAGDITTLGTKVTANETAIKKNTSDITSLSTKITDNETALSKKADKANTLKGYGIEDAYTKEDTDTLLNKKADKTELEKVKATADSNKKALDALGDVQELAKDAEAVKKIANDVESVVKEQNGAIVSDGQTDSDELVKGSTVYDYLNKGQNGDGSLVLGAESTSITMGQGSEATGEESIAIGNETDGKKNVATGKQSVAIGFGNRVTGDHSTVIGDPNTVNASNTLVLANNSTINTGANRSVLVGNDNTIDTNASGSVIIGNDSRINANITDSVALGNNITINGRNSVALGNGSVVAEDNVVSVGSPDNERQIKHVARGEDPTDAATWGQVQEVAQGAYNNAVNLSNSINNLDSRLNKVGAGAAALAALHPIDTDDKFTMGLGYGNYRSANAMAMGMFYRPTEKIMISVGGAFGNGENMVNAGKQLDAQGQEIAALKEALARLEAKIGK